MQNLEEQIRDVFKTTDHSDWDLVKFGEIASNISERIDPSDSDAEVYVGLEHLDSDSIHIRRKGVPSDVKGTKLKVYKGDIIFGKRRAYQRKAAIADFDGICSAHAMVLRANPEKMDPRFCPFFLHSDAFMNRAVEISEGSLSPTIKWKILKEQEFRLPPLPIQEKLAELFWGIERVKESYRNTCLNLKELGEVKFVSSTVNVSSRKKLADCLILSKTKSYPPHKEKCYVGLEHIQSGEFSLISFDDSEKVKSTCNVFRSGQLLYSKLRPNLDKAVIASFDGVCTTELLVYDAEKIADIEYILYHLHSRAFVEYATSLGYGTKMPRISNKILGNYTIPLPPIEEQQRILDAMSNITQLEKKLLMQSDALGMLMKSLLNQII